MIYIITINCDSEFQKHFPKSYFWALVSYFLDYGEKMPIFFFKHQTFFLIITFKKNYLFEILVYYE